MNRNGEGTPQNVHLKKIEPDQSLDGIQTIDDTVRNDAGRKWFVSQAIQPVMILGGYNANTGRYLLGSWRDTMVPNSSWTTTSAAASTLTCPTGHRYRVYYAGARNASQSTDVTLSGTINGNSWTNFNTDGGSVCNTTTTTNVIGGGNQFYDGVNVNGKAAIPELWLNAGDTLTMTLGTYAAGNNTEHLFMFEDYEV